MDSFPAHAGRRDYVVKQNNAGRRHGSQKATWPDKKPLPSGSQDNTLLLLIRATFCLHMNFRSLMTSSILGQEWRGCRSRCVLLVAKQNILPAAPTASNSQKPLGGHVFWLGLLGRRRSGCKWSRSCHPRGKNWPRTKVKACLISPEKAVITNKQWAGLGISPGCWCWSSSAAERVLAVLWVIESRSGSSAPHPGAHHRIHLFTSSTAFSKLLGNEMLGQGPSLEESPNLIGHKWLS